MFLYNKQTSKKQISTAGLQNYRKTSFIGLYKNLSYLLFHKFFATFFKQTLFKR